MKTPKKLNIFMAGFIYFLTIILPMLSLSGCAVNSPLFSSRDNKASVVIEKAPMRIIISGEYTQIKTEDLLKIMEELRKHKYRNYDFDDTIYIDSGHATVHTETYTVSRDNGNTKN